MFSRLVHTGGRLSSWIAAAATNHVASSTATLDSATAPSGGHIEIAQALLSMLGAFT